MCCGLGLSACGTCVALGRRMEPVAVLDYVVPTGLPNIMIDLSGYSSGSQKIAYLRLARGQDEVLYFSIRDIDRDRIVFEGMFEEVKGNEALMKADFSSLTTDGNYRIECDIYGCSENFSITSDHYLLSRIQTNVRAMDSLKDLSASPQAVLDYLQAYEWYGMTDEETTQSDIVSSAPEQLVCVRDWISGSDYSESVGTDAVIYATILAKFSFLYKEYDSSLATECLQKASSIYSQSGNVLKSDSAAFRALAELYRASGDSAYAAELLNYKDYFSSPDAYPDEGYMYGAMTYIVTRQAVDKELCDMLVSTILSNAQVINNRRREITDPLSSQTGSPEEMIAYIRILMSANYILKGYEYDRTMQMMLHYLSGLNVESSVYTPDDGGAGVYCLIYGCMAELESEGKL
jgi:hypothetical protein